MKPTDNENKLAFCQFGVEKEQEFLKNIVPNLGLDITLNPEKLTNKYAPDLLFNGKLADLKTQLVPFFKSGMYGHDPQYTVTLNKKDITRYWRLYRDITIFFWVSFEKEERYGVSIESLYGIWKTDLNHLVALKGDGKLPLHTYLNRMDDNKGNARDSYLIDVRDLEEVNLTNV